MELLILAVALLWALLSVPVAAIALWRTRGLRELRARVALLERRAHPAPGTRPPAPAPAPLDLGRAREEPAEPRRTRGEAPGAPPAPGRAPAGGAEGVEGGGAAQDESLVSGKDRARAADRSAEAPGAPLDTGKDRERAAAEAGWSDEAPSAPLDTGKGRGRAAAGAGWSDEAPGAPLDSGRDRGRAAGAARGRGEGLAPARSGLEWERWLGVRGAAVLGGLAAALAAIFFFQHAVAEGWIRFTPLLRVASGVAFGGGMVVGGEVLRRRGVRVVPDALAGAGVVALYASAWAAQQLYGLVGPVVGFGAMAGVTVLCGWLAVKRSSLVTATLGLLGGFATPLLVGVELAEPRRLFLYLFLLDLGLLAVARDRRWVALAALGWVASLAYQVLWVLSSGPGQPGLALVIVGCLGLLFVLAPVGSSLERGPLGRGLAVGALVVPTVFAGFLQTEFGEHLVPVSGMLVAIAAAAAWVGVRQGERGLSLAIAFGAAAIVAAWATQASRGELGAWEIAGSAVALGLPSAVLLERERRRGGASEGSRVAARGGSLALLGALVFALTRDQQSSVLPWACGFAALAALGLRAWGGAARGAGAVAIGALVALGWRLFAGNTRAVAEIVPADAWAHGGLVLATLAAFGAAAWRGRAENARAAWLGAAAFALVSLGLGLAPRRLWTEQAELRAAVGLALALPLAVIARGTRSATLTGLGAAAAAWTLWGPARFALASGAGPAALHAALAAVAALAFLVVPLAPGRWLVLRPPETVREGGDAGAPWAAGRALAWVAAASPLLWVHGAERALVGRFGAAWEGVPQLVAAACAGILAWRAAGAGEAGRHVRRAAATAAVVLGALGVAFAVGRFPHLVAAALTGAGLAALWRGEALPGWKLGACTALALAVCGTLAHAVVPGWVRHQELPVFNALGYAHAVVVGALVAAARLFGRLEEARAVRTGGSARDLPVRRPAHALAAGGAALAGFAMLNVLVLDAFARTERIGYALPHGEGRDLALSIGWAAFALGLLGFGTVRRAAAPRWASLALLVATLGKVFLVDLGELEGLHRVGSLLGLAAALLAVSLLYQRFVFRGPGRGAAGGGPDAARGDPPSPSESGPAAPSSDPAAPGR